MGNDSVISYFDSLQARDSLKEIPFYVARITHRCPHCPQFSRYDPKSDMKCINLVSLAPKSEAFSPDRWKKCCKPRRISPPYHRLEQRMDRMSCDNNSPRACCHSAKTMSTSEENCGELASSGMDTVICKHPARGKPLYFGSGLAKNPRWVCNGTAHSAGRATPSFASND